MMLNTSMDNAGLNQLPWNELHLFPNLLYLAGLFRNGTAGLLALVIFLAPWFNCITESRERDDWSADIESFLLIVTSRVLKKIEHGLKVALEEIQEAGFPSKQYRGLAAMYRSGPLLTKQIQVISLLLRYGKAFLRLQPSGATGGLHIPWFLSPCSAPN